ncbi:hypothetical protein EZV62_011188 [Acer yangbiense]|uniref:Uncharacterized protein n=1 Tax=Acer yangbiense TaxID=1000413 RepID=A0A5C7I513_9ROSI|nr:hypothetical protein EZV62_011188 [Acer yangbiense]
MGRPALMILVISLVTLSALHGMIIHVEAVDYVVTNQAETAPGGIIFNNQIGAGYAQQTMDAATQLIWGLFQQATAADRKDITQVSLLIVENVVINGQSVPAARSNNQIQVNAGYLNSYMGDVKQEFTGIVYHEMTHVWQWNGAGQAPTELTEGIADFVRLKANYPANGWAQPGDGTKWDEGYSVTARFLDYCDGLRNGFVAELNKKMRDGYNVNFFMDLLGKSVDQLWSDYKANFWLDTLDTPILPYETELTTSTSLEPESTILLLEPESIIRQEIEPNTNRSTLARTQPSVDKELIVYSRRKRPQEEIEDRTLPEQNHESDPSPSLSPDIPGNTSQTDISVNDVLDIIIALRKEVEGFVSRNILETILGEFERADYIGLDASSYGCVVLTHIICPVHMR